MIVLFIYQWHDNFVSGGRFMFKKSMTLCVAAVLVWLTMTSTTLASGWQTIGSLTDPCNNTIPGYLDITQAWVEKNGTQLKFVMIVEGTIPSSTPAPGDDIVFLWLVDADNNPNTGQSTWNSIGNEFNIRAVISHTETTGWVDVVGQWAGTGGQAVAVVTDNRVEVVVDMPQMMSPDLFHFRSDTFESVGGTGYPGNGVTEESAECWVSQYAVVIDPNYTRCEVESHIEIYKCDPNYPLDTATGTLAVDKYSDIYDTTAVFGTMEGHNDGNTPGESQLFGHTMGACNYLHVRASAMFDISTYDAGAYGEVMAKAAGYQGFKLLGRDGQTGPVPHGMFLAEFRHGYHLSGVGEEWEVYAHSFAQVVINDIEEEPVQMTVWYDAQYGANEALTRQRVDTIDLADLGMEFNRRYVIDTLVADLCRTNEPTYATYKAKMTGDSDLVVNLKVVHPTADLNADRTVDFRDMAVLAAQWLVEK
jgi:hypothetical protein